MLATLRDWLLGRRGPPLTDDQIRRIAHQANRPILDALQQPSPAFVSSRDFKPTDVESRVQQIPWFSNCGQPFNVNLTMPIQRVSDWTKATTLLSKDEWDIALQEARNQLSVSLPEGIEDWNEVLRRFKRTLIKPVLEPAIGSIWQRHGLTDSVLTSVRWSILNALMENHYLYTGHRAFFFLELLDVYEAGHFPCGWAGEWPNGELYVF